MLKYGLLTLMLFLGLASFSQSKKELERKKCQTQKDINYTNRLLKEAKNSRVASYNQLLLIKRKIQFRQELISDILAEQNDLEKTIKKENDTIEILENDLRNIKLEYGQMIRFADRHKNKNDILMFIFSSESFNQAYKRMKYVQQYSQFRKYQAKEIVQKQKALNEKVAGLELRKSNLDSLIRQHTQESVQLQKEKSNQSSLVQSLKSKEQSLISKLEIYRKEKVKIQNAIAELIRKEAEKARAKHKASAYDALTPEQKLISNNFAGNKGRLPWPVQRGVITYKYGVQQHPVLKHIKEKKNGIGISTSQGTMARAVFKGKVINILPLTTKTNAIMIKHGEYITVYVNIDEVIVSVGQNVEAKEELGAIYTNPDDKRTTLELQVWKGSKIQNPILWISKK